MATELTRRRLLTAAAGALVLALAAPPAAAHSAQVAGIKIGHAWAAPAEGDTAAVYMPLLNERAETVALTGARTPVAETVTLRRGEGAAARTLDRLELAPGQAVALAAWRVHLRLDGLTRPLEAGDRIPLTLTFEPGGQVTLDVVVEATPGH